jgi:uncharacterized HAD superfamily protein
MTDEKTAIDLANFDFGFSLVDADELDVVQQVRATANEASETADEWQEQAEQWRDKAQTLYKAIQPLLTNLATQPEKEYIYWPGADRVAKIDQFKLRLMQILED